MVQVVFIDGPAPVRAASGLTGIPAMLASSLRMASSALARTSMPALFPNTMSPTRSMFGFLAAAA